MLDEKAFKRLASLVYYTSRSTYTSYSGVLMHARARARVRAPAGFGIKKKKKRVPTLANSFFKLIKHHTLLFNNIQVLDRPLIV